MSRFLLVFFFLITGVFGIEAQSKHDFATTLHLLKKNIQEKGGVIFAQIDHAKNAKEVQMELLPTIVLIFGNPKAGTLLMQENQAISLDLPLKIALYENANGKVMVSASHIRSLQEQYHIHNQALLQKIHHMLEEIIKQSTK